MKVISLRQPWASLVAIGVKTFETRSWSTKYRGSLGVHASKKCTKVVEGLCMTFPFNKAFKGAGINYDGVLPLTRVLPFGAIIANSNLVDIYLIRDNDMVRTFYSKGKLQLDYTHIVPLPEEPERSFGDYAPGRFAWELKDVIPLKQPIPATGRLSLWEYVY